MKKHLKIQTFIQGLSDQQKNKIIGNIGYCKKKKKSAS